jgi:hypothetical protein
MKLVCFSVVFFSNALLLSAKLNGEGENDLFWIFKCPPEFIPGAICGRPHGSGITAEEKVVAGYDVGYYRYPWYVALQVSNVVACGGSLIGSKAVLSAAHCYKEFVIRHDNKYVSRNNHNTINSILLLELSSWKKSTKWCWEYTTDAKKKKRKELSLLPKYIFMKSTRTTSRTMTFRC